MKDILLFDLDGTLTDPKEGITKCVEYALNAYGIQVESLDDLMGFIGPPLVESFQMFYGFDQDKAEEAVEKYRERFRDIGIFENRVYEGIHQLLGSCKAAGKKICLATSKPEVFAVRILDKYGLSEFFDEVVGSTLDGSINAKHEVIAEVFRRLHIDSDEDRSRVIMIGDRKHDILGAKRMGIQSIGVEFGYAEEGELLEAGADYIVDTVADLEKLCLNI